jgi:hypothetical protein
MGRSIIILFLILMLLVSISPQVSTKVVETWKNLRPSVVEAMDNLYAAVRSLVAGSDTDNRTHDTPVSPGVNFDVIITMKNALPI